MNIPFTIGKEEIRLTADATNFEIRKLRNRVDKISGELTGEWIPVLFFASLEAALNRILKMKVAASEASTLKELKHSIMAAQEEINAVWGTR